MKPQKISHLKADRMIASENGKRAEVILPDGAGRIKVYCPFKSIQIIFYDLRTSELPDLWEKGFRKGDDGRYLRTLLCKNGSCEFTVNGRKGTLSAGNVMMDYGVGDPKTFSFTCEEFSGVEITMQVDTLVKESQIFKMLRVVVESMMLPEEEIFDSDGYVFSCSKATMQTLGRLLASGLDGGEGVVIIALTVEIGHNLGTDLKYRISGKRKKADEKQLEIARDIYRSLTEDFTTKYTAAHFAKKYGVSDTTVKNYFKNVYGYGFKEYQTKVRMEWSAKQLLTTDMKIGEISAAVGYSKQTKFTKAFKLFYQMTPREYRREGNAKPSGDK